MKKLSLFILLITAAYQVCSAQTIIAKGTVRNEQGDPVHYAFVKGGPLNNNVTFTDLAGSFSVVADPSSKILISCKGYNDASVDAATNMQVVLKANGAAQDNAGITGDAKVFLSAFRNENTNNEGSHVGFGGTPVFSDTKEKTHGNRFLFDQWVHGYMVKANNEMIQSPAFLFNYDKTKGELDITPDLNSVSISDKNVVKSFTLYGPKDMVFTFEKMTGISNDLYSQVISAGGKYKIYKLTKTKFVPSNYKSNGLVSTGHIYDEYVDDDAFYVLNLKTNNFQMINLKKKGIKEAFADDADKVNAFMASHSGKIDESYLKSLGDTLNQ